MNNEIPSHLRVCPSFFSSSFAALDPPRPFSRLISRLFRPQTAPGHDRKKTTEMMAIVTTIVTTVVTTTIVVAM